RRIKMTFLQLFTLIASGATIFALIVGIFSVYNGRKTRREISNLIKEESNLTRNMTKDLIKEIRDLIVEESRLTRELIVKVIAKG
ncbi:MAG: hypothetical protein ABIK93_10550, partial [candidate division WOR-3 bacterium]